MWWGEMAQQVKVFSTKPRDPNSILQNTHGGMNGSHKLSFDHLTSSWWSIHTHAVRKRKAKINKRSGGEAAKM